MSKFYPRPRREKESKHKINFQITATTVRIVGENIDSAIYPIREALQIASNIGLDLVEISPSANPPICKVVDYQKFLYDQKKKEKELAQKQKENNREMKEIRFTANTDDNDVETKKKKILEFVSKGHKVKTVVVFKGRELQHKNRGEELLIKLAEDIQDVAKIDALPKLEGKSMFMMISPKK